MFLVLSFYLSVFFTPSLQIGLGLAGQADQDNHTLQPATLLLLGPRPSNAALCCSKIVEETKKAIAREGKKDEKERKGKNRKRR